jgi:hypothetical protein
MGSKNGMSLMQMINLIEETNGGKRELYSVILYLVNSFKIPINVAKSVGTLAHYINGGDSEEVVSKEIMPYIKAYLSQREDLHN